MLQLLHRWGAFTACLGRHGGGVGGSYFEWVQANQSYWDERPRPLPAETIEAP